MPRSVLQTAALASELVTREQLLEAIEAVRSSKIGPPIPASEVTDEELGEVLVKMGWVTQYQVQQMKAGLNKLDLGPYIITEFIGQGGMGRVYKGVHKFMGRECAVKVLPFEKATPDSINNFMREIRTQAQLDHPNLVRAFDAGHDGKVHYLVTEFVRGTDLRKLVRSQGTLTQQQAASIVLQAAKGLAYAHERGLIHRDVKPGNILVNSEGLAKVSDLGLAAYVHEAEDDPRAGKVVGTADYLSPEQIRTPGDITAASDIYSLGCTLYYAVTGKVPFPGGTAKDKARRHCEDTPYHPQRFNATLDEEFVELIADMMEKDPKKRMQSANDVVSRLEQFAESAAPILAKKEAPSPWAAAPMPAPVEGGEIEFVEASAVHAEGGSQMSQGTGPVGSSRQETLASRSRPPRSFPAGVNSGLSGLPPAMIIAYTLVIAVPLSMALGFVVAAIVLGLMRQL